MVRLGGSKKKKGPQATKLSQVKKELKRVTEQLESRDREFERRKAELPEALEHQTATSEMLGIISRSPTDVPPPLPETSTAPSSTIGTLQGQNNRDDESDGNMRTEGHVDPTRRRQIQDGLAAEMRASTAEQFVENLKIEILGSGRLWRSGQSAGLEDLNQAQAASANVDAASLVTFVDGISGQQKEDVLNSTLLAQLAANGKHDRERDTAGWYSSYRSVLEQVGWVSQPVRQEGRVLVGRGLLPSIGPLTSRGPLVGSGTVVGRGPLSGQVLTLPFSRVVTKEPRFTPDTAVLRLLKPVSSEGEVSVTKAALGVFRELPDRDRRVVIFESSSHSSASGNFQIVVVRVSPEGKVLMTIAAFFFRTDEPVTRVLSFNFGPRSTQMFQARHVMVLDEAVYSRVRDRIIEQLGDQASALIDDLKIG